MRLGYLSLTNFCPNKCVACPCVHRKYEIQDLSLEHVHESIETAEQEGKLDRLILSGGEPTFNADFLKIMGFLSSRSFPVSITTTSQRFSDISFLKTLLSIFPKERLTITSTIHSFNPEEIGKRATIFYAKALFHILSCMPSKENSISF